MKNYYGNLNVTIIDQSENGSTLYVVIVSITAAVGGFLFGYDGGVITGALPFLTRYFNLNAVQEGFAVSNLCS